MSTFLLQDQIGRVRNALDNPDYSLVLSHTQAKGSLHSLWLCHPTHCLYSFKYFAITDLAENNTSFSSFKLAS